MATFLVRVEAIERHGGGVRVRPGVPPDVFYESPELDQLMQGCALELRRPDGSSTRTHLVTYGIEAWRQEDGRICIPGQPTKQPIVLTLPSNVDDAELPVGTEVWYVQNNSA